MKKNIGGYERGARIVIGALVCSLVFVGPRSAWGLIGLVPLLTGLLGWCPPYQLLGISTCPTKKTD